MLHFLQNATDAILAYLVSLVKIEEKYFLRVAREVHLYRLMKTKIAPNVIAEYDMIDDKISIVRVYRESTGYTFNDPRMDDLAKFTIQGIREGWTSIGKMVKK